LSTIKESPYVQCPNVGLIQRGVLKFPKGGLEPIRSNLQNKDIQILDIVESEEDNDSNGTWAPKIA